MQQAIQLSPSVPRKHLREVGVHLQFHQSSTSALDGGEWSASRLGLFIAVPTEQEAGWAPEPDWTFWRSILRLKCDGTRAETRFRHSAKRTSPFKSAGGVSSIVYWHASCTHQPAGFVLLVQACVLQSRDA
jgi:hypothetical protein